MLDKRSKTVVMIFGAVLLVILLTEVFRPRPISWRPSYTAVETIPFGSFVLFEELPSIFEEANIEKVTQDPYEFLLDSSYVQNSAYFFLNDNLFLDERQVDALIKYVSEGNTAFISANSYGYFLEDSLGLYSSTNFELLEEAIPTKFFNEALRTDSLPKYKKGIYKTVFQDIDTLNTKALGFFSTKEKPLDELNFISLQMGEGQFLLHTLPEAFTNYYMLRGNQEYVAHALSYIDADVIYWDSYLKSGRKIVTSRMRFILSQDSLRWFYYLSLLGMLLLILFKSKREQRVIEVIEPLQNTSIEFTRTIGDLYFQHKDYTNIITKKITYFMEVVRSRYYLSTELLDEQFVHKLAQKSGNNLNQTKKLIDYINHLKAKSFHSETDLIALNKIIQDFKL